MKIRLILYAGLILASVSCSSNSELKKSVFTSDPEDPLLPLYSEFGYNTFGFYYDRSVVISNNFQLPIKVVNNGGATALTFTGGRGGNYDYGNYPAFSISFSIDGVNPQNYAGLVSLNNVNLDLTSSTIQVTINENGNGVQAQVVSGNLVIKRARNVMVDDQLVEMVLSGTFDLQAIVNSVPVSISSGRFDVGVDQTNFFRY